MNFDGINGERAETIRHVLRNAQPAMSAQDIVWHMQHGAASRDQLRASGNVEMVQAVLREMERRGEVRRIRSGLRTHHWSLP